ncbi:MAG: NADP-dependent oxidoreductase [Proteobacteria bacterium]|nr:NADP-dependent oxidoreductase [Pseudomonadota bacterium]
MTRKTNRRILLAARPEGAPRESDFELVETPVPEPGDGELVTRTIYLSLDPYMRGRMNAAKSYAKPVEIGEVMTGRAVGQVVASKHPKFTGGDIVFGDAGWQDYALTDGKGFRKLDPAQAPISTSLGILGMPGLTAYTGLLNIGQPKQGETLVVAAASGAVGSAVGQIGKIKGCRVIGIAGAAEKCKYVIDELGFDDCISHRDADLVKKLARACPDGVDVYWENVGGKVFEAVLPLFNFFARVPVCGLIAQYNATGLPEGPNMIPLLMRAVLSNRLKIQGFIVSDFNSGMGYLFDSFVVNS